MRDDRQRLHDIVAAIDRIRAKSAVTREEFAADELLQVWAVHHLRIIGEAARALSPESRELLPSIPWKQIIGMRHILVHEYFGIDTDVVWSVLCDDLEPLKETIAGWLSRP